jgi:hypothetical protein
VFVSAEEMLQFVGTRAPEERGEVLHLRLAAVPSLEHAGGVTKSIAARPSSVRRCAVGRDGSTGVLHELADR